MAGFNPKIALKNTDSNETFVDVIGNKTDTSFSGAGTWNPSIAGALKANYYHVHDSAKIYPSLADAVVITANAVSWTLGTIVEIIPANTITKWFDVHWIMVHDISANDQLELVLYSGASESEVEIGRISFVRNAAQSQEGALPIQIPPQEPNTRISCAIASKSGNTTTGVKLYYHTYPDIE